MSFEIRPISDGKWELIITGEPRFVHALQMAPDKMERELSLGTWLVVTFPIWSAPVRESVRVAISFAKRLAGTVQLGIRPFDLIEDELTWWPAPQAPTPTDLSVSSEGTARDLRLSIVDDAAQYPLWLLMADGQVLYQGTGPRTEDDLVKFLREPLRGIGKALP